MTKTQNLIKHVPELPEVQTIVDGLRKSIRGWTVADFSSMWEKNVSGGVRNFKKNIVGAKISDVKRKGKYILIELDNGNAMAAHLRMTGALIANNQLSPKHIRHEWILTKGKKKIGLLFSDVRKFGTIDLLVQDKYDMHKGLCKLGADPLSNRFTTRELEKIAERFPGRPIRGILFDQCLIAGIGNIYASEILFDARISPKRKAGKMKQEEMEKLRGSIAKVLKEAIRLGGTSIRDYRDSSGTRGSFQKALKVYNREHGRCLRKGCRGVIVKERLQQRNAYWCPKCQA